MATKKEQLTRITMSQKHDIEAHWKLAKNLIPKAGEIIVYDPDETHDYARFKCGDGIAKVNDLPFIFKIDENYATKEYVNNAVANITIEVDSTLTKEGEAADAKAVGDKFDNYETKENVQKITDELTKVKETAEAARTEEEVNTQIDAKIGALELKKTYEPIGAETRAKAYADDLMTDANLNQYTTEKEVKDIVDTVVADAVNGDAVTGLANLVEYFHTHGEEAAQMGAAITELEGDVKNLKEAPSAGIKATDISAWNGEIGAKALAATKTTAEEVKTQIEAYNYATKTYVNDAVANVSVEVDSTLTQTGKAADAKAVGDAIANINMSDYATVKELDYVISTVGNEFLKLFNETFIPGEDVGETLTWDGTIDGREYYETESGDGSMHGVVRWVHVSDSIPTLEQLSAGCKWGDRSNLSGEFQEYETIFNSEIFDITEDDNCIKISYKDPWAGLFSPVPYIVKTAHVNAGIVYNQPGIYFMTMDTNFMGSVRNTSFTVSGYNFRTTDRVLKVFKYEYTPIEIQELVNKVDATADIYLAMPSTVESLGGIHTLDEAVSAIAGAPVTSNVYVVKSLPTQLRPSFNNGYVMNVYIVDNTGVGYVFMGGSVMTLSDVLEHSLGQEELTGVYNKGWIEDISGVDPEANPGVYCVRSSIDLIPVDTTLTKAGYAADAKAVGTKLNSCASKEWVTNAISNAGTIGVGGCVEVLVRDGKNIFSMEKAAELSYGIKVKIETQVVQELPSTLTLSQIAEGGTIYIYVVLGTGVAYADVGYGAMTLGMITFEEAGWDWGWVESIKDITEDGFYCIQKAAKGSTDIELIVDFNNQSYTFNQGDIEKASVNAKDFAHTILLVRLMVNGVFTDGGQVLHPCTATPREVIYSCAYNYNTTKNFATCIFKKSEASALWNCEYSNT